MFFKRVLFGLDRKIPIYLTVSNLLVDFVEYIQLPSFTIAIHKILLLPRAPYSFLQGVTASWNSPIVHRSIRRLLDAWHRAAPLNFGFDAAVVILVLASAEERSFLQCRQWRKLSVCTWTSASWRSAADDRRSAREALSACSANRELLPTFADSLPKESPYQIQVSKATLMS